MEPEKNTPPPIQSRQAPPPVPSESEDIGDNAGVRMLIPVGRSGWAIAAGYFGLFSFIIFPAPLALIFGIVAIIDIRKSQTAAKQKHGMGRAIFGLVMGVIGTALLLWFVFAAASE